MHLQNIPVIHFWYWCFCFLTQTFCKNSKRQSLTSTLWRDWRYSWTSSFPVCSLSSTKELQFCLTHYILFGHHTPWAMRNQESFPFIHHSWDACQIWGHIHSWDQQSNIPQYSDTHKKTYVGWMQYVFYLFVVVFYINSVVNYIDIF